MAEISAGMVKELREKTDAPMMECKKALAEANGDLGKAEEILRIKLGNRASKAASRVTAEGVVAAHITGDGKTGVQMSAGATSREHDPHVGPANGFVAETPTTRSRALPMFTSTPVRNIVSTRFDRPYDTKGKVSPVVGRRPTTTPMCR